MKREGYSEERAAEALGGGGMGAVDPTIWFTVDVVAETIKRLLSP